MNWYIRTHRSNEVVLVRDFNRAYHIAAGLRFNGDLVKVNAEKGEIDIVVCPHKERVPVWHQIRTLQGDVSTDIESWICNDCGESLEDGQ